LLEYFEATEEISYHTLWDVPLNTGKTALISSLKMSIENKDLPKPATPMIPTSANQEKVLRYLEQLPGASTSQDFYCSCLGKQV
jgi:hypothetical protein